MDIATKILVVTNIGICTGVWVTLLATSVL